MSPFHLCLYFRFFFLKETYFLFVIEIACFCWNWECGGLSFSLWLKNTFRKRIKTSTFLPIRFRDTKCWEEDILIHYYLRCKFVTKKKEIWQYLVNLYLYMSFDTATRLLNVFYRHTCIVKITCEQSYSLQHYSQSQTFRKS